MKTIGFIDYYLDEFTNTDKVVELIFIVLSGKGRIRQYSEAQLKFFPKIVKTKKIKKQKTIEQSAEELEETIENIAPLYSQLKANSEQ